MTTQEVLTTHRQVFYNALLTLYFNALSKLYSDDYVLVRPDGSVLNKAEVLSDLREGGLTPGAFLQLLRNQNFNRLSCRCTPVRASCGFATFRRVARKWLDQSIQARFPLSIGLPIEGQK
jgi:hypothetical protein